MRKVLSLLLHELLQRRKLLLDVYFVLSEKVHGVYDLVVQLLCLLLLLLALICQPAPPYTRQSEIGTTWSDISTCHTRAKKQCSKNVGSVLV